MLRGEITIGLEEFLDWRDIVKNHLVDVIQEDLSNGIVAWINKSARILILPTLTTDLMPKFKIIIEAADKFFENNKNLLPKGLKLSPIKLSPLSVANRINELASEKTIKSKSELIKLLGISQDELVMFMRDFKILARRSNTKETFENAFNFVNSLE